MKIKLLTIIFGLFACSLFAQNQVHTIGVSTGLGIGSNSNTFTDSMGQELIVDDISGATEFSYNFRLTENWAIDANYLTANGNRSSFLIVDTFLNDKFSMDEFSLGLKGILPVSEHNDFFIRLNLSSYHYDVKNNSNRLINKSGIGSVAGIGWQYHFNNGLQFGTSYNYHQLGSNVKEIFGNIGLSYRF